jgi:hypothetical protein
MTRCRLPGRAALTRAAQDDSPASESELSALQAGEVVREAMLARTDVGSEPAQGSPSSWLLRMGGGAAWDAVWLRNLLQADRRGGV